MSGQGCSGRHRRAYQVATSSGALSPFKVSIGRRRRALSSLQAVGIHCQTHRAAGFLAGDMEHRKEPGPWVEQMLRRRPKNVVVVALANKMARTIWAVLAHDRPYCTDYVSVKPV